MDDDAAERLTLLPVVSSTTMTAVVVVVVATGNVGRYVSWMGGWLPGGHDTTSAKPLAGRRTKVDLGSFQGTTHTSGGEKRRRAVSVAASRQGTDVARSQSMNRSRQS